jgi:hypothetical protein
LLLVVVKADTKCLCKVLILVGELEDDLLGLRDAHYLELSIV